MKIRIVSIDGGGIKGIMPLIILKRLEDKFPGFCKSIYMTAGTSTGGIIAAGLADEISLDEMISLYVDKAGEIFKSRDFMDKILPDELWRANYDINDGLKKALVEKFSYRLMRDLKKKTVITAFNLDDFEPLFYKNWEDSETYNSEITEAVLATSAAPTYFQPYRNKVDGGLFANNPADCALAEAQKRYKGDEPVILSLGTGKFPLSVKGGDWGLKQWLYPSPLLLNAMFEGSGKAASYRCKQAIGDNFFRFNPQLPEDFGMDQIEKIKEMIDVAESCDITKLEQFIESKFLA